MWRRFRVFWPWNRCHRTHSITSSQQYRRTGNFPLTYNKRWSTSWFDMGSLQEYSASKARPELRWVRFGRSILHLHHHHHHRLYCRPNTCLQYCSVYDSFCGTLLMTGSSFSLVNASANLLFIHFCSDQLSPLTLTHLVRHAHRHLHRHYRHHILHSYVQDESSASSPSPSPFASPSSVPSSADRPVKRRKTNASSTWTRLFDKERLPLTSYVAWKDLAISVMEMVILMIMLFHL